MNRSDRRPSLLGRRAVRVKHPAKEKMENKTIPAHYRNLAPYEIQAFIDWVLYRWKPEDRFRFASEFPVIYNKIVGRKIFEITDVIEPEPEQISQSQ